MPAERISEDELARRLAALPTGRRSVVAIAGPPGSGKSTVAHRLVRTLNDAQPGRAAVLAMDGYHFDDIVLEARGLRPRKGSPQTFDVGGLAQMLARLRANAEPEIAVPIFDRTIEIARAGAALIPQSVEIVLVEGNYLLLTEPPWNTLAETFDLRVLIDVPENELRRRLSQRWVHHGLDEAGIRFKLEENDLPNGRLVLNRSGSADLILAGD